MLFRGYRVRIGQEVNGVWTPVSHTSGVPDPAPMPIFHEDAAQLRAQTLLQQGHDVRLIAQFAEK